MTDMVNSRPSEPPVECPNGICDRLQIAEWDVQTLMSERDVVVLMDILSGAS